MPNNTTPKHSPIKQQQMNKDTIIEQMAASYYANFDNRPNGVDTYTQAINAALSNLELLEAAGWVKKEEVDRLKFMIDNGLGWTDMVNDNKEIPLATHPQEPTPNVLDELEKWVNLQPFGKRIDTNDLLTKIQSLRNQQQ